jgi:[acyl-carrier-protein] S-malonyltransferase
MFADTRPIAVFPGQGSQHVGMAKDLHENFKLVRELFEEASDAVSKDLRKLCFDGPDSDLTLTENTQPCLLTASVAAFRVAQNELGFSPTVVAGHSLGEYSALVAAGTLKLATAARWVQERGRAMQIAVPAGQGTMAAILGLEDSLVTQLCEKASASAQEKRTQGESPDVTVDAVVEPANYNAPGQIVIAGSVDAVKEAIALIKADPTFAGGKAIPLAVSAPFHCSLMRPARDRMAELFSQATGDHQPKTPTFPYVPNRTGRVSHESGLVFELLVEQIDHPVLWKQTIAGLLETGHSTLIEFGPGKVLCGLAKRIGQSIITGPARTASPGPSVTTGPSKACTLAGVADSAGLKALETMMKGPVT